MGNARAAPVVWTGLLFLSLLLVSSRPFGAVNARIDRSAVAANETVLLVLESDHMPEIRPDLSVLAADFEIVDRRTSHSVSIVNGQRSGRHILTLRLLPRRTGEIRIPSISIGDLATEPLDLSVAASPSDSARSPATVSQPADDREHPPSSAAILEAALEPSQAYVGQQLVLTAKVLTDAPLQAPRLHDPQIPNAGVLPLGEDRYPARRNDRSYQVYERRYAVFPQDRGRLEIPPLLFEGWVSPANGRLAGFAAQGQAVRTRSRALYAEVLPIPDGIDPDAWLPVRSLSLAESGPQTYRARAGDPFERRISLRAEGLMARDLPALSIQAPHQLAKRQRKSRLWDERRPEGVIGTRQEVVTLTAQEPGRYRLPPISLGWWSTAADERMTATLPARDLIVSAAPTPGSEPRPTGAGGAPEPWQQAAPELPADDTKAVPDSTPASGRGGPARTDGNWVWITVALALGWIVTMAAWWRGKRRTIPAAPPRPAKEQAPLMKEEDPLESDIDAVAAAYRAADAGAARDALLAWAGKALPEQAPSNLARLAQRCTEPLRSQILLLEEAFFSPRPVDWDKEPVSDGLRGFVPAAPEEPASFRRGKPIRRRAPNPDAE
jgi:hypothetical protein